jgi:hypothetical protein
VFPKPLCDTKVGEVFTRQPTGELPSGLSDVPPRQRGPRGTRSKGAKLKERQAGATGGARGWAMRD